MANNVLKDFRNEAGYIYITDPNQNIVSVVANDAVGASQIMKDATVSLALSSEITATSTIIISGSTLGGIVNNITVNSVSIIGAAIPGVGTISAYTASIRDAINGYTSSPDYFATSQDVNPTTSILYIHAAPGTGSSPNGYAVVPSYSGAFTMTSTSMFGGTSSVGAYDPAYGHRYYLNANYDINGVSGAGSADPTNLTNAIEITKYLIHRGLQSFNDVQELTISSGQLVVNRSSVISVLDVNTEGIVVTDTLGDILPNGFNEGDLIILKGAVAGNVVTVEDNSISGGNIYLAKAQSFSTGEKSRQLILQFVLDGSGKFYEVGRTPGTTPNVQELRDNGIPIPVSGINVQNLPSSGTYYLDSWVDKGHQVYQGATTLLGNVDILPNPSPSKPYIDGDTFYIQYQATPSSGVFFVTIFGYSLTQIQQNSSKGGTLFKFTYDSGSSTWIRTTIALKNSIDFALYTDLATKENVLGNPVQNGYILSSTTAGVRSWIQYNNRFQVLVSNLTAVNATASLALQTLKSYVLPANTLTVDGDMIKIRSVWSTVNNANNKSLSFSVPTAGPVAIKTVTGSDDYVQMDIWIMRTGATTYKYHASYVDSVDSKFIEIGSSTADWTLPQTFSATVQMSVATAADAVQQHYVVELYKKEIILS